MPLGGVIVGRNCSSSLAPLIPPLPPPASSLALLPSSAPSSPLSPEASPSAAASSRRRCASRRARASFPVDSRWHSKLPRLLGPLLASPHGGHPPRRQQLQRRIPRPSDGQRATRTSRGEVEASAPASSSPPRHHRPRPRRPPRLPTELLPAIMVRERQQRSAARPEQRPRSCWWRCGSATGGLN